MFQRVPCYGRAFCASLHDTQRSTECTSSGAVGWGTALQVGRSRVRFPIVPLELFIDINLLATLWLWGWLQPVTEMSTTNISWGVKLASAYGWQPYHLHVPTVFKSGSLNLLEPSGPIQDCHGFALPFYINSVGQYWDVWKVSLMLLHYTGLFKMIVRVLTTCHTQYTWDRSICFFLFNRTTLQVFVTYLTGALYVHPLWFYKHQHDNQVRSKLFVACQRWWF